MFLKTINSRFSHIEVWFTDQNSKLLEIEDEINITLVKFFKASNTWSQNKSETVESETVNIKCDREIPRERYISPEKRNKLLII